LNTNAIAPQQTSLNINGGYLVLEPTVATAGTAFTTNPYTGSTTVSNGTLEVDRALGLSPVTVYGGTLAGIGTLSSALTLSGTATVPSTIAPGTTTNMGALTVNNNVSFSTGTNNAVFRVNNDTLTSDQLVVNGTVTYAGALHLTITNLGLQMFNDSIVLHLFPAGSYATNGSLSVSVSPAIPALGKIWDTSQLGVDGTLRVITIVNVAPPHMTTTVSGGNLTLSWPADHLGWRLQAQTNLLSVGFKTNSWVDVPGSASVTSFTTPLVKTNPTVFYRLLYP